MYESLSEKLSHIQPISPESRLLMKRNDGVKKRVPENYRIKASIESQKMNKVIQEEVKKKSKQLKKEFSDRVANKHNFQVKQVEAWRQLTANSPYRLDQNEVDLQILDKVRDKTKEKAKLRKKIQAIKNMRGKPRLDFLTPEFTSKLSIEETLAVDHLVLLKELDILKKEKHKLKTMLHDECDEIERKFVNIAMKRAMDRDQILRADSILRGDSVDSLDSFGWNKLSKPKISAERARELKAIDRTVYTGEGRWNESGEFVPAITEQDKVGLMSAKYAQATGLGSVKIQVRQEYIDDLLKY